MNDFSTAPVMAQRYTPEQQAEMRRAIAEQLRADALANGKNPPITISFAPEIDGEMYPPSRLERSPEMDMFASPRLCAKISPKDVQTGITSATAVLVALKALAEAGFDVWDMFVQKFGKPENKQEEKMLKAFLAPNEEAKTQLRQIA